MHELVREWARNRGYGIAWGDPAILDDVKREIARRHDDGEFDPVFYSNALSERFGFSPEGPVKEVKSVLLLSIPRPLHLLRFETEDGVVQAMVPPTYVNYGSVFERVQLEIETLIGSHVHLERMKAPHKAVAARSGLVAYGRNNITFTEKTGSFHQIAGYLTDLDPSENGGPPLARQEPRMMDRCKNCRICQNACPSGAIGGDRFLLHAERCLTFLNEYHVPWPKLSRGVHNSIIGCMTCQLCCPVNKDRLNTVELPEVFTVEETRAILADGELEAAGGVGDLSASARRTGPLWDGIRAKFAATGLDGLDDVAGRNLRALIMGRSTAPL